MTLVYVSNEENLVSASEAIKKGDLIAVPTETVYGLAADATNDLAVAKIFAAKGRPQFNPLISHYADMAMMRDDVVLSDLALELGQEFWPGPLTLIVPKTPQSRLSHLVTAGLDTAGVRVPDNDFTRALIRKIGVPLAAPSANKSGSLSPTTAKHVAESLGDAVDMIIADAKAKIGLESTILDLSGDVPTLLRHGYITFETLQKRVGNLRDGTQYLAEDGTKQPKSPGLLLKHYAPKKPLRLNVTQPEPHQAFLQFGVMMGLKNHPQPVLNLSEQGDLTQAAANLFAMLHELDASTATEIAVAPVPDMGLGVAINDRLRRAAS